MTTETIPINRLDLRPLLDLREREEKIVSLELSRSAAQVRLGKGRRLYINDGKHEVEGRLTERFFRAATRLSAGGGGDAPIDSDHSSSARFSSLAQEDIEERIRIAIDKPGVQLRVQPLRHGPDRLYGINGPGYQPTDQLAVRSGFLRAARRFLGGEPSSNGLTFDRSGIPEETFRLPDGGVPGEHFDLTLRLRYALSTGFHDYTSDYHREVLICSNGMTSVEKRDFQWYHDCLFSLDDFVRVAINGYQELSRDLPRLREEALARPLDRDAVEQLFQLVNLAGASIDRLAARLRSEIRSTGPNEWSLSQGFTWLATHGRQLAPGTRRSFRETGSRIFDQRLDYTLETARLESPERSVAPGALFPETHPSIRQRPSSETEQRRQAALSIL